MDRTPIHFPISNTNYLYPHLDTGALLIVDDIHIPTVHNLFQFLRRDAMFELKGLVRTTAFFTRTNAPAFDPFGDGWCLQNYNARPLLRYNWRERIRELLPASLWRSMSRVQRKASRGASQATVEILTPQGGSIVSGVGSVEGTAVIPADSFLWVLARRKDIDGWWPQGLGNVAVHHNQWSVAVTYGGPQDNSCEFEIAAIVVGQSTHELWSDWVARVKETALFPPVQLPNPDFVLGEAFRTVIKR